MIDAARTTDTEDLGSQHGSAAADDELLPSVHLEDARYGVLREVMHFCYTDSLSCLAASPEATPPRRTPHSKSLSRACGCP